jgi:hypothetical protein
MKVESIGSWLGQNKIQGVREALACTCPPIETSLNLNLKLEVATDAGFVSAFISAVSHISPALLGRVLHGQVAGTVLCESTAHM